MDKRENTSLVPAEPQGIDTSQAEDATLYLLLNGRPIKMSWKFTRLMLLYQLPEWLRNSHIDPPEPPPEDVKMGFKKQTLILMRSAYKNLPRPWLPMLLRRLYGPTVEMPRGKTDVLPVIDLMIIDAVLNELYRHPLEITYDEATGVVQNVRPGQRVTASDHAGESAGGPGEGGN